MKIGIRKPSLKKSIKARTTGKLKRAVKKSVNPLYGKKGMGYINNPKKAVYNKIYNKTTIGVSDIIKTTSTTKTPKTSNPHKTKVTYSPTTKKYSNTLYKILGVFSLIVGVLSSLLGLLILSEGGLGLIIPGIFLILVGSGCLKISKIKKEVEE